MLTEQQRQRFRALQRGDEEGTLSASEQAELQAFMQLIEETEAAYLRPATQRLKQRNIQLAAQNMALEKLVEREMRLQRYLQRVLKRVDAERHAISTELASILEASSGTEIGR